MQIRAFTVAPLCLRISTILVISIMIAGCFTFSSVQQTEEPISTLKESNSQSIESQDQGIFQETIIDYAPPLSISEKTRASTVIVIGQVEQDSRTINTARDPDDLSKHDPSLLSLGQVYQIKIERVLKGDKLGSTLFFVQHEGYLSKPQTSADPSPEDADLARRKDPFFPFVAGHRYLLFLYPLQGFEAEQYFGIDGFDPWRFDITDENNVFPESPAPIDKRPVSLAVILAQIQAALTPTPESTVISPLPTPIAIETVTVEAPALP